MADDAYADLLKRAAARLKLGTSPAAGQIIDERLQEVAATLALEWMVNDRRFESQGQQTEAWLSRLYEVFYSDETPEAGPLYARFDLPMSRAQYVSRQMRARRAALRRKEAIVEVRARLDDRAAEAKAAIEAAAPQSPFEFRLSKAGVDELMALYDRSVTATDRIQTPKATARSPGWTLISVTAEALTAMLMTLAKEPK